MATSKTLAPTNVTISIPAMTDAPNASVISNCLDKEADAINTLNSQTTQVVIPTFNNGSYGTADLFICAVGRVVTLNGYFVFTNAPTGEVTIGNIANYRPSASVRVPCALADAAWSAPALMAYFTVGSSGDVIVNAPSGNTKKALYVSCSWVYQGTL